MQAVLLDLEGALVALATHPAKVADRHRSTSMVRRTHGQPALATTFGQKVAGWRDEVVRHVERIGQARPRILVAELAAGVGTMAAFGEQGPALLSRFAGQLGRRPRSREHDHRHQAGRVS